MKIINNSNHARLIYISCLGAVLGLTACQQSEAPAEKVGKQIDQPVTQVEKQIEANKEAVVDTVQTTTAVVDDSLITAKIKTAILSDELLRGSQVDVVTNNGIVKLSGTVASEAAVTSAISLANAIHGVKMVQNELLVVPNVPSKSNP
jgi:hyperosmotically inducible protein